MTRPSRRHCNIIRNRARLGHSEDQLARALGITRETMRGWAKRDAEFARALEEARLISNDYWDRKDAEARERDERDAKLAANAKRNAHMPHRQQSSAAQR
jgi:hypothetical protein